MLNVSHTFFHNFLWMFLYISHVKFTWSIVHDFTAHISHNFTHISQFHISFSQHLMMWKGGHHFTWFSHGDFTLFFTDVWNCKWKTKWKFHMHFTLFLPVVFVSQGFSTAWVILHQGLFHSFLNEHVVLNQLMEILCVTIPGQQPRWYKGVASVLFTHVLVGNILRIYLT